MNRTRCRRSMAFYDILDHHMVFENSTLQSGFLAQLAHRSLARVEASARAVVFVSAVFLSVANAAPLTLDAALKRVIDTHPTLRAFPLRGAALETEAQVAELSPEKTLTFTIENALGSGPVRGLDIAESTLTLAGVLERGGKREARRAIATARLDDLGIARTAAQFDVLAETARRYLELVGWHSRLPLIEADLAQRERMAEAARTRFRIGAAPEASALRAEAEVAAAKAAVAAGRVAAEVAARRLALMWGEEQTTALDVTPLPISLPELPEFSKFKNSLPASPDLARFASEARIQDARIRLATAGRVANVDWQLGLRHFADTDDLALVGGFSMPLGVSRRAELEASITRAERSALDLERQSFELQLQAALLDAWAQAGAATERVRAIDTVMLPRLHKAVENAERAYAGGALSYAEWSEIQGALSGAQLAALEARLEWRRAMIEIQRLTAEPVVVSQ